MIDRITHLSREEYRAFDAVSQSALKAAYKNPQMYHEKWPEPTKEEQEWGIACESWLRGDFVSTVQVIPVDVLADNGHRRGKKWEAFRDSFPPGTVLMTQKEYEKVHQGWIRAEHNVRHHAEAANIVYSPDARWSERFTWQCGLTGMPLKCEMDLLADGWVCDVKTAADVDPASFERDVIRWGYDIQAAMYLRAASLLLEQEWRYYWVVIRNRPPFNVEVYEASDSLIEFGHKRLDDRLAFFKQCVDSNRWVSPTHGITTTLYPPRWMMQRDTV